MGAMPKLFSSSSYDYKKTIEEMEYVNNNPNPSNFILLKIRNNNTKNLAVYIKYPDATNYEGVKILVFKDLSKKEFSKFKTIDPHFSNNKKFKSPYARFEPTTQGWKDAIDLLKRI